MSVFCFNFFLEYILNRKIRKSISFVNVYFIWLDKKYLDTLIRIRIVLMRIRKPVHVYSRRSLSNPGARRGGGGGGHRRRDSNGGGGGRKKGPDKLSRQDTFVLHNSPTTRKSSPRTKVIVRFNDNKY